MLPTRQVPVLVKHLKKSRKLRLCYRNAAGTTKATKTSETLNSPVLTMQIEDSEKMKSAELSQHQQNIFPLPSNLYPTFPNVLPMQESIQPCIAIRRKLFTPGPLMVSDRVKTAMLTDIAKRHADFAYLVKFVRNALLQIAKVDSDKYTAILTNGSGTGAAEGTIRTVLGGTKKKLLILENGHYALRLADIARQSGVETITVPLNSKTLQDALLKNSDVGAVMVVHCETSSGLVNQVDYIGKIVKKCLPECTLIVDGVTSFGAIPINMKHVDFLVSNACKSLQGVPGVAFVIANREKLDKCRRKLSSTHGVVLDIISQHDELEKSGMFRYTPPTHVMLAFKECLLEFSDEGGLTGRSERYRRNSEVLKEEMLKMGFKQLFSNEENPNGYLVTTFLYPDIPQFVFDEFCKRLSDAGHVICSDKSIAIRNCFRVGTIGAIREDDIRALTNSIRDVCGDMRISLPLSKPVY